MRQLLTESILLSIMGGVAGLALARWSLSLVRSMNPGNIPRLEDVGISGTVLVFTFGISLATGILFGVAPAWRAIKVDLNTALKAGGRGGRGDTGLRVSTHRLRGLLVVSELALSLMLLVGAGLLIRVSHISRACRRVSLLSTCFRCKLRQPVLNTGRTKR